jgi:DNA (cytosine-5)-methyltransferase 1
MRYLSLFSGIEAASVAWEPLGWEAVAFAEIEPFPSAVLAERYPHVPNLGDVSGIGRERIRSLGRIDIVVGGSPCQDLSIAGKRTGLVDEEGNFTRSGLFVEQMRIFEIAREECGARYMLWENVPGAFSSGKGQDFAVVLELMVGRRFDVPKNGWKSAGVAVGPGGDRLVEWRVLDAQYFGVPQRRRRVFALLDAGEWWSRQPVLFECEGVRGDTQEGRGEGQDAAAGAERSAGAESHAGVTIYENHANDSRVTRCDEGIVPTLSSRMGTGGGQRPFCDGPSAEVGQGGHSRTR